MSAYSSSPSIHNLGNGCMIKVSVEQVGASPAFKRCTRTLAEIEREAILLAVSRFGKMEAAKVLGVGKTTIFRKFAEYTRLGKDRLPAQVTMIDALGQLDSQVLAPPAGESGGTQAGQRASEPASPSELEALRAQIVLLKKQLEASEQRLQAKEQIAVPQNSASQCRILELLCRGMSSESIAAELKTNAHAIKMQIHNIASKNHIENVGGGIRIPLIMRFTPDVKGTDPGAAPFDARERNILRCLARGMSFAQVGTVLGCGEQRIKVYVRKMLDACGMDDKIGLVVWAITRYGCNTRCRQIDAHLRSYREVSAVILAVQ